MFPRAHNEETRVLKAKVKQVRNSNIKFSNMQIVTYVITGAGEQQAAGEPSEREAPASSQPERVQQVAEAGQHGDRPRGEGHPQS